MSIEKFEVGKKYRFLKEGDGDKLYCSVDAKKGQEFTVIGVTGGRVSTRDVTCRGGYDTIGWDVYIEGDTYSTTTLDDFEEVGEVGYVEESVVDLVMEHYILPSDTDEENTNTDLIQQIITLQQEHNLTLMFDSDEVVVHIGDNDTEYNISSQKELTTLIEASNVLKSFERR
ncbi:hypothetical protein [Vibrio phage S4-7]|nr:hypothetical protein [Vibrio phage S4-7]